LLIDEAEALISIARTEASLAGPAAPRTLQDPLAEDHDCFDEIVDPAQRI
jgi:hypothetical protein